MSCIKYAGTREPVERDESTARTDASNTVTQLSTPRESTVAAGCSFGGSRRRRRNVYRCGHRVVDGVCSLSLTSSHSLSHSLSLSRARAFSPPLRRRNNTLKTERKQKSAAMAVALGRSVAQRPLRDASER